MNRKQFLRNVGLAVAGTTVLGSQKVFSSPRPEEMSDPSIFDKYPSLDLSLEAKVSKPVTAIVIGAGGRGNAYATYAKRYPKAMNIIGVSDIKDNRRKDMADKFNIQKKYQFGSWENVFTVPKFADAVIISTPDDLHYAPCMKALEMGYDVLLEKPIAPTQKECEDILAQAKKYNRVVAVCHVLRYAPYFVMLKSALDSGVIGKIVSIQHLEPVGFDHMAHSYVRGNWHNSKKTTPIILAKSCHDIDIMRWLVGKPFTSVAADGDIALFKKENMPKGATKRCTDGCPHEATCPYSALDIYVKRRRMLKVFDLKEVTDAAILEKLKTTNYGRCVFQMENDQPDHYTASFTFEGGATGAFSMEGLTSYHGRRTRVFGTHGDIVGDMDKFIITDFRSNKKKVWSQKVEDLDEYKDAGHGGGDLGLVRDFVIAVDKKDPNLLSSSIDASVESHVVGFECEKSRLNHLKIKL